MTRSISKATRLRALQPPASETVTPSTSTLVIGVRVFAGLAALTGTALAAVDLASHAGVHLIAAASTCFILAGIGGAVLCVDAMLADRQEFYQRGHLDGWMHGWHGQDPDITHPLIRG